MMIVTSLHQGYKLLNHDTLLLNSRATKIFMRDGDTWKMTYVACAPIPVLCFNVEKAADGNAEKLGRRIQVDSITVDKITVRDHKLISAVGSDESELRPLNDVPL